MNNMNNYYEEIGIAIKLSEYLNYKNIHHLYIKKYENIQQLLNIYQQGNIVYSKYGLRVNIKNNKKNGIIIVTAMKMRGRQGMHGLIPKRCSLLKIRFILIYTFC